MSGAVEERTAMSVEEFDSLVDAMTAHSKAEMAALAGGRERLPKFAQPTGATGDQDPRDLPEDAKAIFRRMRDGHMRMLDEFMEFLATTSQQRVSGEMPQKEWEHALGERRQGHEQRHGELQDQLAEELKAFGRKEPDLRSLLLKAYKAVMNLLMDTWAAVRDLVIEVVSLPEEPADEIRDWFNDLIKRLRGEWQRIFG